MQIPIANRGAFPPEVLELLRAFHRAGFFDEAMLVGSWVMPLYQQAFGIPYALRTLDIDFAVRFAGRERGKAADLESIITDLGFLPVMMQSGIRKFTRENFSIEFIAHRRGGSDDRVVTVRKWNVTAVPLPFVDILLDFPFLADFGDFQVRAPLPEAFLVQKLLTVRRRVESKKDKDLDQCAVIAGRLDEDRLTQVVRSLNLSVKSSKALREACEAIGFPPQMLGLK
jgi:hypothetical protein